MDQETILHTVVAAQPGWSLAMFLEGGKEPDAKEYEAGFAHDDIVAWHIEITTGYYHPHVGRPGEKWIHRTATPITADGTNVDHIYNRWAIRRPDGVYFIPEDRTLGTEAEALVALQADYEREKKGTRREAKNGIKKRSVFHAAVVNFRTKRTCRFLVACRTAQKAGPIPTQFPVRFDDKRLSKQTKQKRIFGPRSTRRTATQCRFFGCNRTKRPPRERIRSGPTKIPP